MSAAHTSVPRDGGLLADPSATAHLVVAEADNEPTRRLLSELLGAPVELLHTEGELNRSLATASVGVRVYICGSEQFVRMMMICASRAGVTEEEMRTEIVGSRGRRVMCLHCKTITEGVSTTIADCEGCGAPLVVYHHFSRRLAAYMGYRVDAEVPGDRPEAEPL
ncbi:MAG TPA: dimethylamine monooxygenase subunit DmmA family protein [Solirubrobacteraceae bacterium]|nr:dimethylamine monooxygenase subunit DmmA family protein [Solirubrobacteraceae bacterium]